MRIWLKFWDTNGRIQKAWFEARIGSTDGRFWGRGPSPEKNDFFRLKWRVLVNSEWYFLNIWGQFALGSPKPNSRALSPRSAVIYADDRSVYGGINNCKGQCPKYWNVHISTPWPETPKPISVKLRTYNYVVVVTTQANLGGNVGGWYGRTCDLLFQSSGFFNSGSGASFVFIISQRL